MLAYFKQLVNRLEGDMTRYYLITANIVLVVFAIWFSNVGLLPLKNMGDFAFFAVLTLILGLYRPGWTFVFFVGALALENINLAPKELGLSLRPYQFFGFITIVALLVQLTAKRLAFQLPKFRWYDSLPVVFALGGFLSSLGAVNKGASLKQAIIALSFVALYFLVRVYLQSFEDGKRVVPFFLSSGLVVMIYAIWQNISFLMGGNSFEVMPGRPNGTFTEADWLGVYLVFLLSILLTVIYCQSKKIVIFKQPSIASFLNYIFLVLIFVTLILTVSRSAWVGAVFVVLVFLKSVLLSYYAEFNEGPRSKGRSLLKILKMQKMKWRETGTQLVFILLALAVSLLAVMAIPLTRFQLANRAASTGGLQKITISCEKSHPTIPAKIEDISMLGQYGCKHIDLEDIEKEKNTGGEILEISRPDPNVNIRSEIYKKSIAQIKTHPILGLGWGEIGLILGSDERGAGLNASNIFLEVWLGSGLLGFLSLVILLGYVLIASIGVFLSNSDRQKNGTLVVFVLLGWAAIVIPNLFNSGIFLGFVWAYIAVAVSLLAEREV